MAAGEEHVLIVESDILVRQPLADYLRECGYKVVEAVDASEARRLISERKFHIEVVLADVGRENGFALAQWVRKNHPDIDIMLAGTIEKATEQAGTLCEEGPMLTKPYEHHLVLNKIKQSISARERKRREEE